jgi:hypothetical protein
VKSKIAEDPLWGYFAMNGKWICPYCQSAVTRRQGRSREDSISVHLESCRGFGNGHGQVQPVEVIARRQQYENLVHLADSDPAWRVYDASGTWYCPACLERVANVRIQGSQLTSFIYQSMADHLTRCGSYLRGVRPRPEDVQRARDRAARFPALLQAMPNNLQFPSWRYLDAHGHWVCPCCLAHVPRVRVTTDADWQRAPEQIAQHLLQECPAYANDPTQIQPEALVRESAAQAAPLVQPTPAQQSLPIRDDSRSTRAVPTMLSDNRQYRTPVPVSNDTRLHRTPTPGRDDSRQNRTPLGRGLVSNRPGITTPLPMSPPLNGNATPPVARPVMPGTYTPPHSSPVSGTPIVNRRTDTTPTGAPPIARPVTPVIPPPTLPPPISEPTKDDSLFGKLPDDVLAGTVLDTPHDEGPGEPVVPSSEPHEDEDGGGLSWMDDVDGHEPAAASLPAGERTDMIKARAVQAGLMQKPPEVAGFKFAASFEACTDISGDFYQYIRLPDGRIGFAMGDVSGHGVQAGLIMSMAKKTFEIYASMGLSPADTLARVNDAIARDLGGKLFISMVYALLDPTERKITWARAGHTPSLRYNPDDDQVEEIKPPGMVVGMKTGQMFRASLQEQVTTVRSGDVLLLYTDGITETMNLQQEEFDTERLIEVMRRFGHEGADVLVSRIMEIIRHFRGPQPPADDATLLVLTVD